MEGLRQLRIAASGERLATLSDIPYLHYLAHDLATRYRKKSDDPGYTANQFNSHLAHHYAVNALSDSLVNFHNCELNTSHDNLARVLTAANATRAKVGLPAFVSVPDLLITAEAVIIFPERHKFDVMIGVEVKTSVVSEAAAVGSFNKMAAKWCASLETPQKPFDKLGCIPVCIFIPHDDRPCSIYRSAEILQMWTTGNIPMSLVNIENCESLRMRFAIGKKLTSFTTMLEHMKRIRAAPSLAILVDEGLPDPPVVPEIANDLKNVKDTARGLINCEKDHTFDTENKIHMCALLPHVGGLAKMYLEGHTRLLRHHKYFDGIYCACAGATKVPWSIHFRPKQWLPARDDHEGVRRYFSDISYSDWVSISERHPHRPLLMSIAALTQLDSANELMFPMAAKFLIGEGQKKEHEELKPGATKREQKRYQAQLARDSDPYYTLRPSTFKDPDHLTELCVTDRNIDYYSDNLPTEPPWPQEQAVIFNSGDAVHDSNALALIDLITRYPSYGILEASAAACRIVAEKSKMRGHAEGKTKSKSYSTHMKVISVQTDADTFKAWGVLITTPTHARGETQNINFAIIYLSDEPDGQYAVKVNKGQYLCSVQCAVPMDVMSSMLKPAAVCEMLEVADDLVKTPWSGLACYPRDIAYWAASSVDRRGECPKSIMSHLHAIGTKFAVILGDYWECNSRKESVELVLRTVSMAIDAQLHAHSTAMSPMVMDATLVHKYKLYTGQHMLACKLLLHYFDIYTVCSEMPVARIIPDYISSSSMGVTTVVEEFIDDDFGDVTFELRQRDSAKTLFVDTAQREEVWPCEVPADMDVE